MLRPIIKPRPSFDYFSILISVKFNFANSTTSTNIRPFLSLIKVFENFSILPLIAIFPLSRPSRVILVVLDLSNDVCSVYYLFLSYLGVVACLIPGTLAGISITVKLSAVHRLVLNSGRPIIVWVISLALKWQDFNSLQLVGFIIMTVGVIVFNDILSIGNKKSYSEISIKLSLANLPLNKWIHNKMYFLKLCQTFDELSFINRI